MGFSEDETAATWDMKRLHSKFDFVLESHVPKKSQLHQMGLKGSPGELPDAEKVRTWGALFEKGTSGALTKLSRKLGGSAETETGGSCEVRENRSSDRTTFR